MVLRLLHQLLHEFSDAHTVCRSYFVGDAAGRGADAAAHRPKADHSACDKEFAEAVGIEFKLPEDVFTRGPEPEVEEIEVTTGTHYLHLCFVLSFSCSSFRHRPR